MHRGNAPHERFARRRAAPLPQVTEHEDQAFHLNSQWTGQALRLHSWLAVRGAQTVPPFEGSVTILRVRIWVPPLHLTEQPPQPDQPESLQLTVGQLLSLHTRASIFSAQPEEAEASVRRWTPLPQLFEHALHAPGW